MESAAPVGWNKTEAGKFFTFYLPKSMHLVSEATCFECAWGSTYSDTQIRLDAEYTSWNEEYAPDDLAKRADYTKELATIDGHRSKIQGWRLQQPEDGYHYTGDLRIYDAHTGKLKARMTALCKTTGDLEITKQIFTTIQFLIPKGRAKS